MHISAEPHIVSQIPAVMVRVRIDHNVVRVPNPAVTETNVKCRHVPVSPPARLVITLLEIEDRSVREIAQLTGWSVPLVKVRAFRARAEMRKILMKMATGKYL